MLPLPPDERLTEAFRDLLRDGSRRLTDMREVMALLLLAYFAGYKNKRAVNHCLLEGLNGTAKTTIVREFNSALVGEKLRCFYQLTRRDPYVRLAGSPDQTPADISGFDMLSYDEETGRP